MKQPDLSSSGTAKWNNRYTQLPSIIVWSVVILCLIPAAITILNPEYADEINFNAKQYFNSQGQLIAPVPQSYVLFQWSAFCIAIFTAVISLVHYKLKQDLTTAVICIALFFSGMLDGLQVLASTNIAFDVKDPKEFIPLTWVISRFFNIGFLIAGIAPFVWKKLVDTELPKPTQGHFTWRW